ncbi:MAG: 2-oxoglutarate dehydrogenase complex dihydrolipoyllysine-residue succinyltransferase [Pseudomonadota bacterium]|jgi:2-oxoglutarate dehydrogenase E2 component (dihydrolipoamide succinyltransferase)|nr:dihydrolipoyllysine-residue succinyltransferase [Rhodospirillaceae bacterium]MEC7973851.1 2-oxoglutarate dehydrogenase complex dihydrolipoyllysine-residue succinyltransferase [Pseudomonadota bacterium]MEC9100660.1 2-oxoglutarate dehydrogenase complex dihydrolipoyllysine-residue succinyltransferase [Pseudomonadota bacterium]|tara:strand:- start:361 stop:1599 length:1239 start_codon:yes stop_codon:yes gene_type:complete
MSTEVVVPALGESVTEATVAGWLKNTGDMVALDEPIVELETDKVTVEVNSPVAGMLDRPNFKVGETVDVGAILCIIKDSNDNTQAVVDKETLVPTAAGGESADSISVNTAAKTILSPSVRKIVEENNLDPKQITGTGKDGRLVKGDVLAVLNSRADLKNVGEAKDEDLEQAVVKETKSASRREERVKMSRLRQAVARRLKEAQNTAAMLTTYNEADMSAVISMRNDYKVAFEAKYKVRLGFMSFFVKACVDALRDLPAVNAEIAEDEIIYKNYYDIGVAVGSPKGLVVPVLRDADKKGLAEIERSISDFGARARDGKLTLDELSGGTFTISNGGVYGSLMSSPILNPPQSGILGIHKIQERPIAVNGSVEIRPMMYLALSYDHRIVDGREAVTFLVKIKETIEDPRRLVLEL